MTYTLGGTGIWNAGLRFGDRSERVESAAEVEELGYTAVWVPDVGGDDLFDTLKALLSATNRITVATGILNLWMHDPAEAGRQYTAATAEHGRRLLMGIGVSHAPLVEQAGVGAYRKPLARMQEFLDGLDAAPSPVPAEDRVLAALGPKMLELARGRSAGAHPYLVTPEHTSVAREVLGPDKLLAPEQGAVLESDPARARAIARAALSVYFGLPKLREQLETLRIHRRGRGGTRQRPTRRRARGLGRRGDDRGPRAGASGRGCRPRVRPGAH